MTDLHFVEIALAAVCKMAIEARLEAGRLLRRYCSDPVTEDGGSVWDTGVREMWTDIGNVLEIH